MLKLVGSRQRPAGRGPGIGGFRHVTKSEAESEAMLRVVLGLLALVPFTAAFFASPVALSGAHSKFCFSCVIPDSVHISTYIDSVQDCAQSNALDC